MIFLFFKKTSSKPVKVMYAEYEENARYTFIKIEVKINSNFINCSQKKSVKKTVFFQKNNPKLHAVFAHRLA